LFAIAQPGFSFDTVEIVVSISGGASVAVGGGDPVIYVVVGVDAISCGCLFDDESAGCVVGIFGEVAISIEDRFSLAVVVIFIPSNPTNGIGYRFLTV
jgi:hypothetical protein